MDLNLEITYDFYVNDFTYKEIADKYGYNQNMIGSMLNACIEDDGIKDVICYLMSLKQPKVEDVVGDHCMLGHKTKPYYTPSHREMDMWLVPHYHRSDMGRDERSYMLGFRGLQEKSFTERLSGMRPHG